MVSDFCIVDVDSFFDDDDGCDHDDDADDEEDASTACFFSNADILKFLR